MQINSVNSYQNFTGKNKDNSSVSVRMNLNDFLNATDNDLYDYARFENQQKHKGQTAKFIGACIGIDALSNVILKDQALKQVDNEMKVVKAPLSAKLGAGLKSIKGWALGFAAVGALMGVKTAILNKNEKFREFEEQKPVLSLCAEVGVLAAGYQIVKSVAGKIVKPSASMANKTAKLAKKIDNSKVATKIMNSCTSMSKWFNGKFPALGKTCRVLLANSVLLMIMAGALNIVKNNREVEKSYQTLKSAQDNLKLQFYQNEI